MKYKTNTLIVLALTFLLGGCGTKVVFTKTGDSQLNKSKDANCSFTVYSTPPKKQYEEVGVVEFSMELYGEMGPSTISDAKSLSQKYVCEAGGNGLLLWEANGFGQYLKATVIKTQ